ncbi:hypothetical protein MMH89_00075 [Candidatus Comchoanobacter bicostacola]|uniref:Uncharacterized protein n=1 Tax=Candidatus Comchoanobacter bicostacola TaxID=2919598 RepID=A0ABY5DKP4_9GAMM|nr:hypothetical protein [Candidatus Comchoanobacter bicostacola]UTC24563.1 hypothetical protein MMH89_00075 [Candidatus Comchoanobacter bicostacola]
MIWLVGVLILSSGLAGLAYDFAIKYGLTLILNDAAFLTGIFGLLAAGAAHQRVVFVNDDYARSTLFVLGALCGIGLFAPVINRTDLWTAMCTKGLEYEVMMIVSSLKLWLVVYLGYMSYLSSSRFLARVTILALLSAIHIIPSYVPPYFYASEKCMFYSRYLVNYPVLCAVITMVIGAVLYYLYHEVNWMICY